MPFGSGSGKRKLIQDAGGSESEEEHNDAHAKRGAEAESADDHDDGNAGAGEGDDEEEPVEQDAGKIAKNPLLDEVIVKSKATGKNPGGSKSWQCKHCKKSFTSSFTRIRVHFLGPVPGQKAHIHRCSAVLGNQKLYKTLYDKVHAYKVTKYNYSCSSLYSSPLI